MDTKSIFKWAATAVVVVIGTIYLASALLISDKVVSLIDFRTKGSQSFQLIRINEPSTALGVCASTDKKAFVANEESASDINKIQGQESAQLSFRIESEQQTTNLWASSASDINKIQGQESAQPSFRIESEQQTTNLWASIVLCLIKFIVVAVFLLVPIGVVYVFMVCPIRDIPLVEPCVIQQLTAADGCIREEAGAIIAQAMCAAESCPEEDRDVLQSALERPAEIDKTVKELLEKREQAARKKALEIAAMAGLTMAVSSSSIGDGLGMFVWKSRLVYETFRIYGFRPKARTVISIWAHIVFASFFAASLEELCDLFDVSEFVGGVAVRLVQSVAGSAVVLKGGELTRAYLLKGVSSESRRSALEGFRKYAKDDLAETGSLVTESMCKIGFKGFFS